MPKTRRQLQAEAAVAEAAPAPEPPKQRKTTARKPKAKKKEDTPPPTPEVPLAEQVAAEAPAEDPVETLLPRLRERVSGAVPDDELREVLQTTIDSMYGGEYPGTEEDQEAVLEAAFLSLPVPEGEASAASASAASPAAPSEDDLLEEAKKTVPSPKSDSDGEEDSPAAAAPSPQEVMSIRVPITGQAIQYTIEVKAKSPGPVAMEASQATASQGTVDVEDEVPQLSVRWYPVTDAAFPEKLGERFNLIFPAHKMAPVAWSEMKESNRTSGETYYAFTVAEAAPGSVFGQDYTLMTGDPKKVAAAGVFNTYVSPTTGVRTVNLLDMGTREDVQPNGKGGPNPYLTAALKSLAQQMMEQFKTPDILVRYSRKQLFSDSEYLSTRNTLASLGIPLSSFTRGGPEGKEALFKIRGETQPVDISNVKLDLAEEGADRIVYEYREEGTGATKTFTTSALDRMYVVGRRGIELAPTVEFVGSVGAILMEMGTGEKTITIPDPVLRDGFKRVEPRRGGRKTTKRKRATSRRSS